MNLKLIKNINFKQPKYMLPALLYPLILVAGYFVIDMFGTKPLERQTGLESTEYLNSKLPEANYRGDGIGDKATNMRNEWGNVTDFSAISDIEADSVIKKNQYESRYTDEDLAYLAQAYAEQAAEQDLKSLTAKLDAQLAMVQSEQTEPAETERESAAEAEARQRAELEQLTQALAEAAMGTPSSAETAALTASESAAYIAVEDTTNPDAVTEISDSDMTETVVKARAGNSGHFNTLTENTPQSNLIKAIIDEDIKCVDGSRVRLRLLDDVEINGMLVKKGNYMYATVSGFGSQRVKGRVQSLMVGDVLCKINLSVYDTDGLEGLYVPQSQFRETMKNVASSSLQGANSLTGYQSGGDNFAQWGMRSLQNAISQTSSALSKGIKQNSAKLKYGTFVYLVNGSQTR